MKTEILWNYYKALSEPDKDTAFSINWFYTGNKMISKAGNDEARESVKIEPAGFQDWTKLNDLTKAFLADVDAMDNLKTTSPIVDIKTVETYCQAHYGKKAHKLNESQKKAIMLAINNPITIVQGPPGTGKTETIKNLLICLREHDPNAKIAMVSTNKDAVDNVEDKIKECDCLKNVYARLGKKSLKVEFEKAHPTHKMSHNRFNSDLLNEFPIILSTIHSLRKCINFNNQYDYVIVDECSQVSTRLGLLAMASAKHLVLFGDDNQLSPIHKYTANDDLTKQVEEIGEYYLDRGDNSFMHACYERFGDKAAKVMLDEHYRCHPNIINFCNQTFYDGKLKIKTATNDNNFPIRIRWYEGDYWERIYQEKDEDKDKEETKHDTNDIHYSANNYNMKQIEIFIEEEFPHIIKKFIKAQNNNSEYSMCVLSPYKCQIKKLTEKFNDDETLNRLSKKIGLTPRDLRKLLNGQQNNGADKDNPDEVWDLPSWSLHSGILKAQGNKKYASSIHKAQGKEYDYICVMPVVDYTSEIWHQSARITNVAISRAKEELCYIMSANWMPETTPKEIMDERTNEEMLREALGERAPIIHYPPKYEEQNMGYLTKLVEYVIQNEEKWKGSKYGLIRTDIHSIFDIDRIVSETFGEQGDDMSAPEKCLYKILYKKIKNDKKDGGPLKEMFLHYNMRLGNDDGKSNIVGMNVDDNAKEFIKNAHLDFVLTRGDDAEGNNGKIALIIEVDGAQHRGVTDFDRDRNGVDFDTYKKRQSNDELKDSLVRTIGKDFYEKRFLRLKTDGTTCNEIELIIDRIKKADKNKVTQPKFKEGRIVINEEFNLFADLRSKLNTLFVDLKNDEITKKFITTMKTDPEAAIEELQNSLGEKNSINFNCGGSMDYSNPWICRQYMLRYTMAYAFEYYVMYCIALSQLDEPTARAYSFSCGSCIDCLSLAYAKIKLDYNKEVSYRGIDVIDWAENFELTNLPVVDAKKYVDKKGMLAFLKKEPEYMPNILFFPKILSELNSKIVTSFCNLLKDLKSEELIVCISYRSLKTMSNDLEKVSHIITVLEEKYERKELKYLDKIYNIFNISDTNERHLSLKDNGIFEFKGENKRTKIYKIDDHFTVPKDIWSYIGVPGISGICAKAKSLDDCDVCNLKEQCPHSAIANVDHMCFQIIHLKKKS